MGGPCIFLQNYECRSDKTCLSKTEYNEFFQPAVYVYLDIDSKDEAVLLPTHNQQPNVRENRKSSLTLLTHSVVYPISGHFHTQALLVIHPV